MTARRAASRSVGPAVATAPDAIPRIRVSLYTSMSDNTGATGQMRASRRPQLILAFAATYVFWGGSFLAIRFAVREIPPLLMMAARCSAGAAILVSCLILGRE